MDKNFAHSHHLLSGGHTRSLSRQSDQHHAEQQLDVAVGQLNDLLAAMEQRLADPSCDREALAQEVSNEIHRVEEFCRAVEIVTPDTDQLRAKQAKFREQTDEYFSKSYLMRRARTWPRGYPGDHEIIEAVYNNEVRSDGIGELLDRYFLSSTLARGIQRRREKMRDTLAEQLLGREQAQVLNIGCGPCREVLELAPVIEQTGAHFTNVDFDTDALTFSARRLIEAGIGDQVSFRQYNAIRMVNTNKNLREFGRFDIIYTIGLLDYLTDEVLVRLIRSLHATLNPGGVLIAVFKDCDNYATEDYHWLVDWSAFYQRDAKASRAVLEAAGITGENISVSKTSDSVMIFYHAVQTADLAASHTLQGPHDRRQQAGKPEPEVVQPKRDRRPRPSWRKPEQTS